MFNIKVFKQMLKNANLQDANLRYADLRYADLQGANLRYANLRDYRLSTTPDKSMVEFYRCRC